MSELNGSGDGDGDGYGDGNATPPTVAVYNADDNLPALLHVACLITDGLQR